jgi:exosome complex RNA-binding protein Csl4
MRGHGTYTKDDVLHASVAGIVQRVNKLISVVPPKTKYQGKKYSKFQICQFFTPVKNLPPWP